MTKRPLVGITTRAGHPGWNADEDNRSYENYRSALAAHGIDVVRLSPYLPAEMPGGPVTPDALGRLPDALLEQLDGLLLSGGGDVDPSYFGAVLDGADTRRIDTRRDELELGLARSALARDMPVFGICRGCQVLNVAAGGGMIQHFDGHRSPESGPAYHPVAFTPESRLRAILDVGEVAVNTYHHQGLDRATLAPGFAPVGFARPDDWLVEAFESPDHGWVVGVQWHPERLYELSPEHGRLWESFAAVVKERP